MLKKWNKKQNITVLAIALDSLGLQVLQLQATERAENPYQIIQAKQYSFTGITFTQDELLHQLNDILPSICQDFDVYQMEIVFILADEYFEWTLLSLDKAMSAMEVDDYIAMELEQNATQTLSQYDYFIVTPELYESNSTQTEVLSPTEQALQVVANKIIVQTIIDQFLEYGIHISEVEPRSLSLYRAMQFALPSLPISAEYFAMIDIGDKGLAFDVYQSGTLIYHRFYPIAVVDLAKRYQQPQLQQSIHQAIQFYQSEYHQKLDVLLLNGRWAETLYTQARNELQQLSLSRVELFNPMWQGEWYDDSSSNLAFTTTFAGALRFFSQALGLDSPNVNLLQSRAELVVQQRKGFILGLLLSVLLALLGIVAGYYWLNQQHQQTVQNTQLLQREISKLDEQLKPLQQLEQQKAILQKKQDIAYYLQGQRPAVVRLLDEIARLKSQQMYFTKIQRVGNQFIFEGRAKDTEVVAEFMRYLEQSIWFRNVSLDYFQNIEQKPSSQAMTSLAERPELNYGQFSLKTEVGELAMLDNPSLEKLE